LSSWRPGCGRRLRCAGLERSLRGDRWGVASAQLTVEEVRRSIATDFERWAPELLRIVPKGREYGLIPFKLNAGQLAFEEKLAEQRAAGKPQRAIILKCRQVGFSTLMQGRLILAATQLGHLNALCVADSKKTGAKLYAMGERMY